MPKPNPSDDSKPISDAASLFDTEEVRAIHAPPTPVANSGSEGYDLEGGPISEVEDGPPQPIPIPIPTRPVEPTRVKSRTRSRTEPAAHIGEGDTSEFEMEVASVDPPWSRWAEWGSDLIRVGFSCLGICILAWLTSGNGKLCLLILIVGAGGVAYLIYPILVTLERPVRITPEQAVDDFFAAASHHFPHYRRMWLLLSSRGRESGPFPDFESFQAHWKEQIQEFKAARNAGKFTPLKFEVDGFRADKSTGKLTSKADYTINIFLRDHETDNPIDSIKMTHGLVKGPDRMWYLNRGILKTSSR